MHMAAARATSRERRPHGMVGGARLRTIRDARVEPDLAASDRARGSPATPAQVHESRAHPEQRNTRTVAAVIATPRARHVHPLEDGVSTDNACGCHPTRYDITLVVASVVRALKRDRHDRVAVFAPLGDTQNPANDMVSEVVVGERFAAAGDVIETS